ncbi:ABC transporter permease subunit [Plantactinospora sp. ZYX-F-223]|uniref:ABC transporter permease subunit n=1 Tax=Plantactinospora sp. ZYX-F-223 TaxID=3144103 RepID=UPI0031FDF101
MPAQAVLRSEWTKVRSVRSHAWTLAATFVVVLGISATVSSFYGEGESQSPDFDATALAYYGLNFGQLAVIAFGVIVVSGEYSSGMIRTSLAAVPRRGLFLACKLAAATAAILIIGMITSVVTFFVTRALMPNPASLDDPGTVRAIVGAGLYLALLALFSMAVTFMLRSSVLAMGVLMPMFFLISPFVASIEQVEPVAKYMPDRAGILITQSKPAADSLGPWVGLGLMAAWVAVAIVGAWIVLRRRDA